MSKSSIVKNAKKVSPLIILLFLLFFGLHYVGETGVYFDERSERSILAMNLRQYGDSLHLEWMSNYFSSRGYEPIYGNEERDHGVALYYPFVPALYFFEYRPDMLSTAWHTYTFLLFFIGVVYLYRLLRELFENRSIALLGTAMFYFTPRIFADGLYNNKDTVLLSTVLIMLFYGIRFIEKKDIGSAVFLGISAGFAGNIKISGLYVFVMIGLFYLADLTIRKRWSVRTFLAGLLAMSAGIFCYIIITPAIWGGQGIQLVDFLKWNLTNATQFSRLDGTVLFEGTVYQHSVNPLPWYYLPKIIFLTIPVYVSVLIGSSVILWCKNLKKGGKAQEFYPLFALCAAIPIVVAIFSTPNLYNGWRHLYFIYGPLTVMAAYPLNALFTMNINKAKIKISVLAVLGACLLVNVIGVAINGIYSTAYVNFCAGDKVTGYYEMDYYGVTAKKILLDLMERYDVIYLHSDAHGAAIVNYDVLPEDLKSRIVFVNTEEGRALAENNPKNTFYFINTSYDFVDITEMEVVLEYKSWGNTFVRIGRK